MTATTTRYVFCRHDARDDTVDHEYVLRVDGDVSDVSVQICEGGYFAANRAVRDADGNLIAMDHAPLRKSLAAAKRDAIAFIEER